MDEKLETLQQQVAPGRNYDSPPLELWNPDLSGDIDIRIAADGRWYHEEQEITRDSMVRLFASILRREEDGDYYLVTPREKWRVQVELHPLVVTDINWKGAVLEAQLNTGRRVMIGGSNPLFLEPRVGNIAAIRLWHGLAALFSRPAWYRLVELADEDGILRSGGEEFPLS